MSIKKMDLKEVMDEIYLDNHTTSKLDPFVLQEMLPYLEKRWGNYLQPHQKGSELTNDIYKAYEKIYDLIGADVKEDTLLFTSSNEEAISFAFHIAYRNSVQKEGKNHFLSIQSEDAPILMNLKKLESHGCKTIYLALDKDGVIDTKKIAESITPRCAMVSLTLASGITGLIQPILELKEICKLRGIYLHLDISYAIGKMEIDVNTLGADFITFGGDKFHGPKSSGILYVRPGIQIEPLICGGLEQRGYRGGVLDASQLVGLGCASKIAKENISEMCLETASLRDLLERYLEEGLEDIHILFNKSMRLPNVSVIAFQNVVSDALLYALNQKKVYASIGGVQFQKLNHLLTLFGNPFWKSDTALSFSLSKMTTAEEIKRASEIIIEEVIKLRKMSENMEALQNAHETH